MSAWLLKAPASSPVAMAPYAMAKDTARGKVVMFGGTTNELVLANVFETWEWGGSTWAQIITANSPSFVGLDSFFAQGYASMAYDPVASLMVMPFPPPGANLLSTPNPFQTWVYGGVDWTQLSPAHSPSWQGVYQVVYDTFNGYVLMVNSYQFGQFSPLGDQIEVWKWDGADWTLLWGNASSGGTTPNFSFNATMGYDPVRSQAIVFGGGPPSGPPQSDSTFAWDSATLAWSNLAPSTHPTFRDAAMIAYSDNCAGLIMFGGSTGSGGFDETWLLPSAIDEWALSTPAVAPSARQAVGLCPDVVSGNLLLFGGEEKPSATVVGDTWTFRCSGAAPGVPVPTLEGEFRVGVGTTTPTVVDTFYVAAGNGDSTLYTAVPDGIGGFDMTLVGSLNAIGRNVSGQGGIAAHPTAGLFGATSFGAAPPDLRAINPANGVGAFVGHLNIPGDDGFSFVVDIAFHPDGTLYAVALFNPTSRLRLYTVNVATGAAALVGSLGIVPFVSQAGFAIDSAGGGWLLSAGTPSDLYRVDLTTGVATSEAVTLIGFAGALSAGFSPTDVLYISTGTNTFKTISLTGYFTNPVTMVRAGSVYSLCWLRT